MVPCEHWTAAAEGEGICARGFFGGRPQGVICTSVCLPLLAGGPVTLTVSAGACSDRWKRTEGPKLWAELHAWAQTYAGDREAGEAWLGTFAGRIGCAECARHWAELVAMFPPDFSGAEALYLWTVARHNDVNRRLGRPAWSPAD